MSCERRMSVWWMESSDDPSNSTVFIMFMRRGIGSVGRALDCKAGGRGFDPRGGTNT